MTESPVNDFGHENWQTNAGGVSLAEEGAHKRSALTEDAAGQIWTITMSKNTTRLMRRHAMRPNRATNAARRDSEPLCGAVAGHFPLAFLAEGPIPAAGYSGLAFRPCSGSCQFEPDSTHANANRKSLGRLDGRAAVALSDRCVSKSWFPQNKARRLAQDGPCCQSRLLEIFSIA